MNEPYRSAVDIVRYKDSLIRSLRDENKQQQAEIEQLRDENERLRGLLRRCLKVFEFWYEYLENVKIGQTIADVLVRDIKKEVNDE